jgi:large subunit ribosomal protein L10
MTRTEKDQLIDELAQILAEKNVVYLTDASGLDSDATTSLRRECYKKDIRVRVVKNTLLRQAMERTEGRDYAELYDVLKGQTALLVGDIGNAPARVLKSSGRSTTCRF